MLTTVGVIVLVFVFGALVLDIRHRRRRRHSPDLGEVSRKWLQDNVRERRDT